MTDSPNPYEPAHVALSDNAQPDRKRGSVFATWVGFYLIGGILLLFTMPATSHSNNWSGILPAFFILTFGAYRLARVGARPSTTFVYGCSTTLLFLFRFLTMGRFSLWLEYQAPSTPMLVVMWVAICLFLGAAAFGIAYIVQESKNEDSLSQNSDA